MKYKFIKVLRKISQISSNDFSMAHREYKELFEENFLNKVFLNGIDDYLIKSSIGKGSMSKIWWTGIFDRDFYKKMYNTKKDHEIGASKGYYIVYLWNIDRTRLYLAVMPASEGLSKLSNAESYVIKLNDTLRNILPIKPNYLTNIQNKLDPYAKNNTLAKDYELGTLFAIEYDLSDSISDEKFISDIYYILEDWKSIKNILMKTIEPKDIYVQSNIIVEESVSDDELVDDLYENHTKTKAQYKSNRRQTLNIELIEKLNNRNVTYKKDSLPALPTANRSENLADYIKETSEYTCACENINKPILQKQILWNHTTLINAKQEPFIHVHHLVPMKYQYLYEDFNLDQTDNMICLCVTCHNAIHNGNILLKRMLLKTFYEKSSIALALKERNIAKNFEEFYDKFYK